MHKILEYIDSEELRQKQNWELIASENFVSEDVKKALGSCLTNKYAEGYPEHRYYGGCQVVDQIESATRFLFQELFKTDYYCNVQPHSGSQANEAAYRAILSPGDSVLAMGMNDGGHLTHGSPVSFSGQLYKFYHYGVTQFGRVNTNDVIEKLRMLKPKLLVVGASSYSRYLDYEWFRWAIDKYSLNTLLMVDMAHVAGLIAAGEHPDPFGYADIVTTTTQKTLRGPRGGLIFCKTKFGKAIDSAVFPGTQGGPLMNVIAAKGVCAEEAMEPEFKDYIQQVLKNAKAMAEEFKRLGYKVVSDGTDNHMFVLDLRQNHPNITGLMAQEALDKMFITVNKQCVPGETRKPAQASGIRIGTPAMTTKGWKEVEFIECAKVINNCLKRLEGDIS